MFPLVNQSIIFSRPVSRLFVCETEKIIDSCRVEHEMATEDEAFCSMDTSVLLRNDIARSRR